MSAPIFRVHFENGRTLDITAPSADDARRAVKPAAERYGPVRKVKRLRERETA